MISTALTQNITPFSRNRLLQTLVVLYAGVWIWGAIDPVFREDWLLENILVVAAAAFAIWLYRVKPLSDVSSILCVIFLALHTVGSHYTYSLVPVGEWLKNAAGLERNHYDRVIHFAFGFLLTYPVREMLMRMDAAGKKWINLFAFSVIATCSGFYELIEWGAAVVVDPEAGAAFLGTQGDEFDAQADHVMALIGSLITLAIATVAEASRNSRR
jgi:putative membrane protein